jgi:hypothetical protein
LLTILELSNEHLFLSNGETIYTNETHKFAVYNKDENKFEMVETKNINKDIHILVDTEIK